MPDCSHPDPEFDPAAWQAGLRLRFADDGGTTRLVERSHHGPLRVQKALYPEGPRTCHAILIHPPGGVVGGDRLEIDAEVGAACHTLLTTPGAAKWYRANGKVTRQQVRLRALAGASLEWLPQESIFYHDAHVVLEHEVELAADARYIGSDILCLGRRASGEAFASGAIVQRTSIRRGGKLVWWEQGRLAAGGAAMGSALGLRGATVCATLVGVGPTLPAALMADIRALDPALGATQSKGVFSARYLCDDSQQARITMQRVWQALRPHLLGCAAPLPRIWTT